MVCVVTPVDRRRAWVGGSRVEGRFASQWLTDAKECSESQHLFSFTSLGGGAAASNPPIQRHSGWGGRP